ncbi:substrate-binding domain-containing protein [Streptomyces sp. NPDC048604]|uniref:substrate-binding domain-containing protein n=1 Tax=Streptomyces sp. NPDC048604 TaxID=3365578 RepID=UPI00371EAD8E
MARDLRVSVRSVQRWRQMWDEGGPRALRSQGQASLPRLSEKQLAQLEAELANGPAAHGWEDQRWTLSRVKTVIGDGHRRIGFLGDSQVVYSGAERFRGYWAAHEAAGLQPDERYIRRGLTDVAAARQAALALLSGPDAPTALFCTNNRMTHGAIRAVHTMGGPVGLAGFDDFELSDVLGLPLTIVSYDADEIGRRAARMLLDRIDSRGTGEPWTARRTVVPTRIIRYGTAGAS